MQALTTGGTTLGRLNGFTLDRCQQQQPFVLCYVRCIFLILNDVYLLRE
jgi:hypothetical protein